MNGKDFISASEALTKYIVDYAENIRDRRVLPNVEPGYIRDLLPNQLPEEPEKFEAIMDDIEKIIMPGVTHWHSPRFHAYFPTGSSYPSILADMLCGAIGCIGFSWISSPACTELEVVMLDWLGELIGLPKEFLAKNGTNGGGVIQVSASDATLVTLLSAKQKKLNSLLSEKKGEVPVSSLVAYASDEAHSSVERAAMLGGVKIKLLPSDEKHSLKGEVLRKAIQKDLQNGLIPFYVVATIGTTNCCSFDDVKELGEVCKDFNLWIHVDAAYAGSAFVCEEYRYLMDGVELVNSFNFNPHKWLLVNFDCSAMWVKNSNDLVSAFNVDPVYLKHEFQGKVPDYRHWQIPLGRRFRSLKLWFVMRIYGKSGLQKHIKKHIRLAKEFEEFVRNDSRFEIFFEVMLGLVCFRLKGSNKLNEKLVHMINHGGIIHLVPGTVKEIFFLRFAICSQYTESHDVALSWDVVKKAATDLLKNEIEN